MASKLFKEVRRSVEVRYEYATGIGLKLNLIDKNYFMLILFQSSILVSSVLTECSTCKEVTGEGPLTGTYLLTDSSGTSSEFNVG